MKRKTLKTLRYTIIFLIAVTVGLLVTRAVTVDAETDAQLVQIDSFIESHSVEKHEHLEEMETVSLSYEDWKEQNDSNNSDTESDNSNSADYTVYSVEQENLDVWQLGLEHGISELDTTRILKLITYEGYGESPLSYYVACCCYVRATEGYWGYSNLYQAFGEADTSYDVWLDEIEIADYAFDALTECYLNPSYVKYCNGMTVPDGWVYEEGGIYVW